LKCLEVGCCDDVAPPGGAGRDRRTAGHDRRSDRLDRFHRRFLTVGVVGDDTAAVARYVTGDEVDVAFEFAIADGRIASVNSGSPDAYTDVLGGALAAYPAGHFAPFLTNHDQNRVMSQLRGDGAKARLATAALLTLPEVPFLSGRALQRREVLVLGLTAG
jgi:hypothetical protein